MNEFEKQYEELKSFLEFEDYSILVKRIIDLTLDTEDLEFYKKTATFLDWYDVNEAVIEGKKERFAQLLAELYTSLSTKTLAPKSVLVSTNKVEKSYGYSSFSIGPIDMELKQGEILGLVGENGNGKTTLLRLLCGELYPTDGKLNYHFEYDDQYDLRTQLVYIPQRTESWHGSMFENLQFTAASYGYKPEENAVMETAYNKQPAYTFGIKNKSRGSDNNPGIFNNLIKFLCFFSLNEFIN